jgi:hypothetical protein
MQLDLSNSLNKSKMSHNKHKQAPFRKMNSLRNFSVDQYSARDPKTHTLENITDTDDNFFKTNHSAFHKTHIQK